eukprot:g8618.t1
MLGGPMLQHGAGTLLLLAAVCVLLGRLLLCLRRVNGRLLPEWLAATPRPVRRDRPVKTMVVLGSGGHTAEMLALVPRLNRARYAPLVYVSASTDVGSQEKAHRLEKSLHNEAHCSFRQIPRSREVGQSYLTSALTTVVALLAAVRLMWSERPELLLVNGPGTCVPICWALWLGHLLFGWDAKLVFVESFCRVDSLSLSGRLLYPLAARFLVHWPQLQARFRKAEYVDKLI